MEQTEGLQMIWITKKTHEASDSELATGTFADGLFPVLAAQELSTRATRTFRSSYGQDYSLASKRERTDLYVS